MSVSDDHKAAVFQSDAIRGANMAVGLREVSENEALDMCRALVGYKRSIADLAREAGIAPSKVSEGLSGSRSIPPSLLALAGIRQVYVKDDKEDSK